MKTIRSILMGLCLGLLIMPPPAPAQQYHPGNSNFASQFAAYNFGTYAGRTSSPAGTAGTTYTITIVRGYATTVDGINFVPYNTNTPIQVGAGAVQETVTPTSVSGCGVSNGTNQCQVTAAFTYAHGPGTPVISASYGLDEALNYASQCVATGSCASGGGLVMLDPAWTGAGGTTSMITAAPVFSRVSIEKTDTGVPEFWNPTPQGAALAVPTTLTSQAACDATHQFCSDATVAGSASWGSTIYGCVAYVDIMGNEGPCSLASTVFTSVASKAIDVAAPAASTGAVGYVVYLSLSGGTYAQAYQIPSTSTNCTLTQLEVITPACAVTNTTYNQAGSTFGADALFTGGSQITTYPLSTGLHFTTLASVAMTAASQTPVSNSATTYAYVPGSHVGLSGISPANSSHYAASGSSATLIPNAIATWTIPANKFNYVGAEFRVSGKFTYTDGGDSSTNVYVKWDAPGTNTTTVGTTLCNMLDTATGTSAAYNGNFTCVVKVVSVGATGTALVNGYSAQSLAAGATTLVRNTIDIATAASGSINLTAPARISVYFIGTGATNNPGAQGLEATIESIN